MIVAKAPLRISFAGGGSDIPAYFRRHGGAVLSVAIQKWVTVSVVFEGSELRTRSVCDSFPGSGLGGSSATVVASLAAWAKQHKRDVPREQLVWDAYHSERVFLEIAGGVQDHVAAVHGGFNLIEFDKRGLACDVIKLTPVECPQLADWLLLVYTGKARTDLGLAIRKDQACERGDQQTVEAMEQLKRTAWTMRAALGKGDLEQFGGMLMLAWQQKLRSSPDCSTKRADLLLDYAIKAGAIGGKLCGAGGGGYLLLCCDPSKQQKVKETLEPLDAICEAVAFDYDGVTVATI